MNEFDIVLMLLLLKNLSLILKTDESDKIMHGNNNNIHTRQVKTCLSFMITIPTCL